MKITFMGAGSSVFVKNIIGDVFLTPALCEAEIALYDIDAKRLGESYDILTYLNNSINENRATIKTYHGVENRGEAVKNADFIVNAIQVGGYEPCTVIDFEIPKKYGLRQTIGDTLGIGGIFRGLRTINVMKGFADDIEKYAPNALFLNYTNPMAIITGYMQRYTNVNTIGLCHSVQVCSRNLLQKLGMVDVKDYTEKIAGINHMAWLLEIKDKNGNDLYPEIKKRAAEKNRNEKHDDMVRFDYIEKLGYYCTESSEHNAEYNNFYIKPNHPELIEKFNIPLDEYPRRCVKAIEKWAERADAAHGKELLEHTKSEEYGSRIMNAIVTDTPYKIGGNVINKGLITNLSREACVEVPCLVDGSGISPTVVGNLPPQLAAMNMTNINVQLLTIEAAVTKKKEHIYHAAMLDPVTSSSLTLDEIIKMCDELIEAHEKAGFKII